jgi:hypothetical protein
MREQLELPCSPVESPKIRRGPHLARALPQGNTMNNVIYIVGLIVVVIAVLSFFGLR